jgi:CubicO group peptidase (beta-lactamase class C family)
MPEPPPQPASTDYSTITAELSQLIQGVVDESGITGLSVALVDDREIVWEEGFGFADKENGVKATPETVYGVASVSKLFTATAIMQLAENGKIDIDQPLQSYIPGFSINSRFPESGPITARNVMTHHSGLPSNLLNGSIALGDNELSLTESAFNELVQEINSEYVTSPANTTFSYSNLGYGLLGHAVEQPSGQDFIGYVDKAIFQPLGMNTSSFSLTTEIEQLRSKEYRNGEEVEYTWTREFPAGSLSTNVQDLSRFMMMVFGEGEVDGQRILEAETLAKMLEPQHGEIPLDIDVQWGLGWWLVPIGLEYAGKNAWHSGGEGMWNSQLYTLPDHKLGVVVLANSAEAANPIYQIAETILAQALAVKTGIEKPEVEAPEIIALSAGELLSYAGKYTTDLGRMDLRVDQGDLYADLFGTSFRLLPHADGQFSIEGLSWSDAQMTIRTVEDRTLLKLYGLEVGALGYGERIEPSPVPQAWMDRLGSYEISNGKVGFTDFFSGVQLRYEDEFLLMDVRCAIECEQIVFPIGPISDDEAVILGRGRGLRGDTVSVVEIDGEEHLAYSGYLLRKLAAAVIPDQQPLTDELLAQFTAYIEETMESYKVPGMAVVVVQGGEVAFAQGFGVKELGGNDPITPDTLFSIGSTAKAMTSMMAASVVDDGTITWDTPVVEVMPQFQLSDADATGKITMRHLFAHTSGLPNMDLPYFFSGISPEGIVESLKDVPLNTPPGEGRTYQNEAFAVGGYVAAMAAGAEYGDNLFKSYIGLMQTRVFDPIGMPTATFSIEETLANPNHATPHYSTLNCTLVETGFDIAPTNFWNVAAIAPAGEVRASARDVGRFLMTMLAEGVAPDGTRIVSAGSLAETWTGQIEMQADPWLNSAKSTPGWSLVDYEGIEVVTKDGALGGFVANIAFIPDADTGIVVLSNLDFPTPVSSVNWRLVELLYGLEPNVETLVKPGIEGYLASLSEAYTQLLPVDYESVAPYLGEYESKGAPYTIEWRDGKLWYGQGSLDIAQLVGSPEGGYLSISPSDFYLPFQFVEGEDGSTTMVVAGGAIEAQKIGPALGRPFQLSVGQTAKIGSDGPWVEFLAVESDYRCPLDVVCVRGGEAKVNIGVRFSEMAEGFQELTLEIGVLDADAGQVSDGSETYLIEASVLDPYPRTSVQETPEYVVTLSVEKIS